MGNIRFGLHREYPPFLICFLWVIVSFYFLVAIFEPFFLMHDPNAVDYTMKFAQPSIQYPFGCDQLGRCVYSRIIQGISGNYCYFDFGRIGRKEYIFYLCRDDDHALGNIYPCGKRINCRRKNEEYGLCGTYGRE